MTLRDKEEGAAGGGEKWSTQKKNERKGNVEGKDT